MTHMKTVYSRFLVFAGVLIMATPSIAQDQPVAEEPPIVEGPSAEVDRPRSVDPVTQENIDTLTRSGVIERQAKIGEDILIIEREIRRVQQLQSLMGLIGYEGVISLYPEMANIVQGSPLETRAKIEMARLEQDLDKILNPEPEKDTEKEPDANTTGSRSTGSGIMDGPVAPAPGSTIRGPEKASDSEEALNFEQALEEARQQLMLEVEQELERRDRLDGGEEAKPISLREIYGTPENLRAVIFHGAERIQIREGDTLTKGVLVQEIGPDYIVIRKSDQSIRLSLRG